MNEAGEMALGTGGNKFFGGVHHPWRRLLARQLDMVVFGVPVAIVIIATAYVLYPPLEQIFDNSPVGDFLVGPVLYCAWIPIEAGLLAAVGFTPAKWLFGIRVYDQDGAKLTYTNAFKRASLVLAVGEGLAAIPVVSAITRLFAYRRLTKSGTTVWDESAKSAVTHRKWSGVRLATCVAAYLALIGAVLYAGLAETA